MTPLTTDDVFLYESQKVCYICKRKFCSDKNDKNRFKLYKKSKRSLPFHSKM